MTEQHECEWRLTVGHSNCKACHYSAIEGVAVCEICNESLGPTEIERRLNGYETLKKATEALSAEDAISASFDIKCLADITSGVDDEDRRKRAALQAYANILEGKDG